MVIERPDRPIAIRCRTRSPLPAVIRCEYFILPVLSQENPERSSESSFHLDRYSQWRYYPAMKLSARNSLIGKVEEVKLGNVMAHVVVRVGDNIIDSVITRRSAEEMGLKVGDTVAAIIKSTEVMLQKD